MMYGNNFGCRSGFFGMGWYMIFPIIFTLLIIYLGYKLFSRNDFDVSSTAMETLNQKFVNGEITEEDYLKRKQIIKRK